MNHGRRGECGLTFLRLAGWVAVAVLWLGCRSAPLGSPELARKFPSGVFTEEDRLDGGLPGGFGSLFRAVGEPRLSGEGVDFALRLRFTDWGTEQVVRLEGNESKAWLVIKTIENDGRPETIRVTREVKKEIAPAVFDRLRGLARRVPRLDGFDGVVGFDGWSCLLEIVEDGQYRAMYRWTPEHEMRRRKLREFAALANFLVEEARPVMDEPLEVDISQLLRSIPAEAALCGPARRAVRIIESEKRKTDWSITSGPVSGARMAEFYREYHERLVQRKTRNGGFAETIAALEGSSDETWLASYKTERHVVSVFLNPANWRIMGCIYQAAE